MMKPNRPSLNLNVLTVAACISALGISARSYGECPSCPAGQEAQMSLAPDTVNDEATKRSLGDLNDRMHDTNLDNPDDSTTGRAEVLEVRTGFPPRSKLGIEMLRAIVIDRLRHDSYAGVRRVAAKALGLAPLGSPEGDEALIEALRDPSLAVRVEAAVALISKENGTAGAEEIVRDAGRGVGRDDWNVKGLYSDAAFKSNRGVVEEQRDNIQMRALVGLFGLRDASARTVVDSLAQYGVTSPLRDAAKRLQDVWSTWPSPQKR